MNILELKRKALGYSFKEDGSGDGGSGDSGVGGYSGFGGVGTDPGVTGTNPQTTSYGNIGSTIGGVLGGFLGPIGSIFGKIAGSQLSGTTSDISGNQTQFNAGGGMGSSTDGSAFGSGNLGSILNIAGGINALTGSSGGGGATTGDPFAQYRSGLAAQYAGALQPGGTTDIQGMPGYTQFNTGVMQPALQATQRAGAATGQLYSGGEAAALQKQSQQGYYGFMTDYLNRLSTGSGASASPLGGAQLANTMQNQQQAGVMQGIGAIGQGISGLSGLFGNAGSTTPTDMSGFYTPSSATPSWAGSAATGAQPMTSVLGSDWGVSSSGISDFILP